MTNKPDPTQNFMGRVKQLGDYLSQLQQLTQQTIQVLTQHGFRISGDVNALIRQSDAEYRAVQQSGHQLQQQVEQFQELLRISALLTSSLELDKVLEDVMDTVISLTGAERAYLMLKPPDQDQLLVRAARNWDKETLEKEEITFSRGIIQAALEGGEPILTTNAQSDERFQSRQSVMANALRSIIVIPLILQDKAIGVLYADNRMHKTVFTQNSVPLLTAFANQATIAIQNAREFERVKVDLIEAQREVRRLQIEIDRRRLETQVDQITESSYFQNLSDMAKNMRKKKDEK